jgi:hypothetical protein
MKATTATAIPTAVPKTANPMIPNTTACTPAHDHGFS